MDEIPLFQFGQREGVQCLAEIQNSCYDNCCRSGPRLEARERCHVESSSRGAKRRGDPEVARRPTFPGLFRHRPPGRTGVFRRPIARNDAVGFDLIRADAGERIEVVHNRRPEGGEFFV
jgi:hypothetical protein